MVSLSETYHLPVTVNYSVVVAASTATRGSDYALADGTLTFNPRTATSPGDREKQIVVTLFQDNLNEDHERVVIRLTGLTNAVSNGADVATLTIIDSNAPPTVRFVGAGHSVAESGGSTAFTVELSQVSDLAVAVPYTVAGTASPGDAALGTGDHNLRNGVVIVPAGATSARVRFAIVNDRIDEDNETVRIRLGTPLNADLVSPTEYVVTIVDDDTAGVNLSGRAFTLNEGQSTTYSVALNSQPTHNVSVRLEPDAQLRVNGADGAVLSFTPLNWSQPQTVTLAAFDDRVDEEDIHQGALRHVVVSADPRYDGINQRPAGSLDIAVSIRDDDTAGVVVAQATTPLTITEGLTGTYSVRLNSQPTAPVTVTMAPNGELTTSPVALAFDATNWNTPRTVTITAMDDRVDEDGDDNKTLHDGMVAHAVASADPRYASLQGAARPADVRVKIRDNDTAGIALSPGVLTLGEGATGPSTGIYTVTLTSRPTDTVTIDLTATVNGQIIVAPTQLAFTPAAWNTPQTVMVTVVQDDVAEAPTQTLTIRHSARGDRNYGALSPVDKTVTVLDDDTAGIVLAPATAPLTLTEGLTGTYSVRLNSQPTAPVRVSLTVTGTDQIAVSPPQLTFDAANWTAPQTVTVTALDNDVIDGARAVTIAHAADASDDPLYAGLAPLDKLVTIVDDDVAGIRLAPEPLALGEGAAGPTTGAYTVTLTSRPTAPVTITLTATVSGQITVSPTQLVFGDDEASWRTAQTVTVTAVEDDVAEAPTQTLTIRHSASSPGDANYSRLAPADKIVTVADDDEAGLVITPLDGTAPISETTGFNTSRLAVELRSEPTAPVTVTLTPDDQLTVSAAALVFDATTWSSAQIITVTAVDDLIAETTPHTGALQLSGESADPNYNLNWRYEVLIDDNDPAIVGVSAASGTATSERGGAVTFQVWLTHEPAAPVTIPITLSAGAEAELSVEAPWSLPLVFDKDNWSRTVTVTVRGLDDDDYDGPRPFSVSIGVAESPRSGYANVVPAATELTLWNDDDEPALVSVGDAVLAEGAAGETMARFPVTLHRASPVTVTVSYESYGLTATAGEDFWATSGAITFTPGVTGGVIEVPVFGDALYEPDELFGVRLTGAGAEGDAVELGDADGVGTITNDDEPGARFERAETIVAEGAGLALVVVRLDEPQGAEARVDYRTLPPGSGGGTAREGEDFAPQSGTLSFPPGVVTQTISLALVDDGVDEELYETVRLELSGASGAPLGDPYTATVTIVDDDGPAPLEAEAFLVMGGPDTLPTSAYFYTGAERGYGYALISVPCSWPGDRALTVELWSAAMHGSGSPDRAGGDGLRGAASFELYDLGAGARGAELRPAPGAPGSLLERSYAPSDAAEQWASFHSIAAPTPCGRYALRFAAQGDDENFWAARAGFDADGDPATPPDAAAPADGARIRLATLGATVEHRAAPMATTSWFYVAPGTLELRLRTYDLDRGASGSPQDFGAGVRFYAPGQGYDPAGAVDGVGGTPSVAGWATDVVSRPAPGWWRAVVATTSAQNGYILEAEGDGAPLPIEYEPPAAPLVSLSLTPSAATAAPGEGLSLTLAYASLGPAAYGATLTVRLPGDLAFDGDPCAGATPACASAGGTLTLAPGALPPGVYTHSLGVVVAQGGHGGAPVALEASFGDAWGNGYRASAGAVIEAR